MAATLLLCLFSVNGFTQNFSRGIAATYRTPSNVTYMKSGSWEGKLDLYYRPNAGPQPTLIWIHGGGMDVGTKDGQLFALMPYLEAGWNVINLEPRYQGVTLAPATLQNTWCALRWVVHNAAMYQFDTTKIVISGASSGSWFALSGAMTPRFENWDAACPGNETPRVAAVVNWYGIFNFADLLQGPDKKDYAAGWVQNLPNPLEIARMLAPVVNASTPPTISVHGDSDPTVPYTQSVKLHEAPKAAHVKEQMITIPGGKHGGFTRAENERAFAAIEAFLKAQGLWPAPVNNNP
jgi:acetyl esterase/lipase